MINGLNQGAETTLASSLWPGLGEVVASLEDMLSPAALMGEYHAGFIPVEGVFHPSGHLSVPPSSSPRSQQKLGMGTTSPCRRWVRWAGEIHWAVPPGNTRGFPVHPKSVLLEETSVIHLSVMLLNHLFTPSKNPEHQQVFSHWPNNHQVPHSHVPLQHSLFTWPNNPTLDTHQPHDNFVLHYRYISPQNMNMLKHPIMFWHACQKKKPMATKTTACQWQLLHAHTKLNYILLKRDIIMAFVSPHPHPFPPKIKGEISTHLKH